MKLKQYILFFALVAIQAASHAQAPSKHHLGLKTSINFSSLLGDELQNPRPKFGYTAGPYAIINMDKKLDIYTEFVGNFKGARFSNGDTGYSRIALFYMDFVAMPIYNFNEDKNAIAFGPYASYLALSSLYIGDKKKAELNDIGFRSWDAGICAYLHIKGKYSSFQVGTKVSFLNANKDVNFVGYFPKTGNGGVVRNVSLEIGMLF